MRFVFDDGGRAAAGYRGSAGDCVTRSVAIIRGLPYQDVYRSLSGSAGAERKSKGASARNGIHTNRKWFKDYMAVLGFRWTPTMQVGSGCRVHLRDGELPNGRLVVNVSKHLTAVIDGVIHDTDDPQRDGQRCVYGYWELQR